MDELSRALRQELEKRDDTILALELLVVDQASRLLALESLVLEALAGDELDLRAVEARVAEAAERFRANFEAIEGFAERTQRIAREMMAAGARKSGKASKPKRTSPAKPKAKAPAKKKTARR